MFKPKFKFERERKEKSAIEVKAEESLALAEQLIFYSDSEEKYYVYTDLREAIKEINAALKGGNTLSAYRATQDLIQQYGERLCNLGALYDQLEQERENTDQATIEHYAQHIAQEHRDLSGKAQTIIDGQDSKTFLTDIKQKFKNIADKAKYTVAIAALVAGVGTSAYTQTDTEKPSSKEEVRSAAPSQENNLVQIEKQSVSSTEVANLKNADPEEWRNLLDTDYKWTDSNSDQLLAMWKPLSLTQKINILVECGAALYHHSKFWNTAIEILLKENTDGPDPNRVDAVLQAILKGEDARRVFKVLTYYDGLSSFYPILEKITNTQLTTLLEAQIQQPSDDYYDEESLRADVNNIFNSTTVLTDTEKLSFHQQIDQQYPDQPFEELLSAYEKVGKEREGFFWGDVWGHANPETKIKFIHAVAENETFDEYTFYEAGRVIKDYYFYPEAKSLLQTLVQKISFYFFRTYRLYRKWCSSIIGL